MILMEVIDSLDPLLKTFWYVAIPVSLIFIVQSILTFSGTDGSDGVNPDFDGDIAGGEMPFQLLAFRNLIHFLLGFSWSGISFYSVITNPVLLIGVSVVIGVLFVLGFFFILRQVQRLSEDNSFKYSKTIDKTAEVYLSIPAKRTGKGKVLVSVNGSVRELDAITDQDVLKSGSTVKVIGVENNILIVA